MLEVEANRNRDAAEDFAPREVVVCVDDEPAVLDALRRLFRAERYDVIATADPKETLRIVRTRPVGVVIADQRMPEMEGVDLLERVAESSPSTARILLTAYPSAPLEEACRQQGVQRFVTKPWRDDDLKRAVKEALAEREKAEGYREIY
jgi:response regulator RpfG family c-di-GMP phosphodiesterase